MDWSSKDVLEIIYHLLPGFVSAWIFYGLTAHPKKSPFERTVQALIFTAIVQAFLPQFHHFGHWLKPRVSAQNTWRWSDVEIGVSLAVATAVGLIFSLFANTDWLHRFLRWIKLTRKTSYPSVWFRAFYRDQRPCVLNLCGDNGRRLYGWIEEWPDGPGSDHFVVRDPHWILSNGETVAVTRAERFLVRAEDVEMVEWIKFQDEITTAIADVEVSEKRLIEYRLKQEEECKTKEHEAKTDDRVKTNEIQRAANARPAVFGKRRSRKRKRRGTES